MIFIWFASIRMFLDRAMGRLKQSHILLLILCATLTFTFTHAHINTLTRIIYRYGIVFFSQTRNHDILVFFLERLDPSLRVRNVFGLIVLLKYLPN